MCDKMYQLAIRRVATYIRSQDADAGGTVLTAFEAAPTLALAFDKEQEQVIMDLVQCDPRCECGEKLSEPCHRTCRRPSEA